jgi:hypothetical protein
MNNLPVIEVSQMDSVVKATELSDKIVSLILSGGVDPLEVLVRRKLIEKAFEQAFDTPDVKDAVSSAIALHPKGKAHIMGAEVTEGSRVTIQYDQDATYAMLKTHLKEQEERVKAATKTGSNIVSEDGELLASPVETKSTNYFTVKLPK